MPRKSPFFFPDPEENDSPLPEETAPEEGEGTLLPAIQEPPSTENPLGSNWDKFFTNTKIINSSKPAPTQPSHRPYEVASKGLIGAAKLFVDAWKDGEYLTLKQLADASGFSETTLTKAFQEKEWIHFFREFGLDPPGLDAPDLSKEQLVALTKATNPFDSRRITTILREADISIQDWRAWMTIPEFRKTYNRWMRQTTKDAQGEIMRKISAGAIAGDFRDQHTFLRLIGVDVDGRGDDKQLVPLVLKVLQQMLTSEELLKFAELLQKEREKAG